jgi:esterase/lipase
MSRLRNLWHSIFSTEELAARHRPSGVNDTYQSDARTAEQYLDEWRWKVEAGRADLDQEQRDWIVEGNSPFVLKPDTEDRPKRGILMVHGLTDAPFLVRDIARFFQQRGFYVFAILLPGHGTRPGDLLNVRWQDWLQAHQHALDLLVQEADDVYMLGFSAGATLSLYQALRHLTIKGLFLFSPAIRVRRLARLACPLSRLGKLWKRLAWLDLQPDTDFFKYESISNAAICEAYKLIEALNRLNSLATLKTPLFVAASENDATVDTGAVLDWFAKQQGMPKRMLYYSTGQPEVPEQVKVVHARLPAHNIRSFSHTAMLHPPSNPHYGANGSYRFCTHYYFLDRAKYQLCRTGQEDCLGEMFDESSDCAVVRRLTYNPLYEDMLAEIDSFLAELSSYHPV